MPIQSIPTYSGPTYGGYVQGVNLQAGYDESPSTLTLTIVNESGKYKLPGIGSSTSVKLDSLSFSGYVKSYTLNEENGKRILSVVLEDRSSQLDRKQVVLYKRGIPGATEYKVIKTKTISKDTVVTTASVGMNGTSISFKPVTITKEVARECYGGRGGDETLIILGEEQYTSNPCAVSDSDYTFRDLGFSAGSSVNSTYRASYEGSLRSVLQSWCADFGWSFYWDYSGNQVVFVDMSRGINSIPDSTDCRIIRKSTTVSNEGTFKQRNYYFHQKDYKENEGSFSQTFYQVMQCSLARSINLDDYIYSYSDAIKIYECVYNLRWEQLGIRVIASLPWNEVDTSGLDELMVIPNGTFYKVYYDEAERTRRSDLNSEAAGTLYYNIDWKNTVSSNCGPSSSYKQTVTTTPSYSTLGSGGLKYFTRSVQPIINVLSADESSDIFGDLGGKVLQDVTDSIINESFGVSSENVGGDEDKKIRIFYVPPRSEIDRIYGLSIQRDTTDSTENFNEPIVVTPLQQQESNCQFLSPCKDEDGELDGEINNLIITTFSLNEPGEGLVNNYGQKAIINCNGKTVEIITPTSASYQGYYTINVEASTLITGQTDPKSRSFWKVTGGLAGANEGNIKENRVTINNVTTDYISDKQSFLNAVSAVNSSQGTILRRVRQITATDFIGLPLSARAGLDSLDVTMNDSEGFTVQYTYSSKPPKSPNINLQVRPSDSRLRRSSFRNV